MTVISHSKKLIFIHNYKVAGTSIEYALRRYDNKTFWRSGLKDQFSFLTNAYPPVYSSEFSPHITAADLKKGLPDELFSKYFKFGFVRDPWDWQVSMYSYILKTKEHHQHELLKSMKSFDEFIEWRINEDFHLQKEFFYDEDNRCLMDYIGKFETIGSSIQKLFDMFCLDTNLLHLNQSRDNFDYLHFYSQRSIDMVAEAYRDDLLTFGYSKPKLAGSRKDAEYAHIRTNVR